MLASVGRARVRPGGRRVVGGEGQPAAYPGPAHGPRPHTGGELPESPSALARSGASASVREAQSGSFICVDVTSKPIWS
jgi:hypothetical protein